MGLLVLAETAHEMEDFESLYNARRRITTQFMEMDEDNNGFVTASELHAMLKVVDPSVWTDTAVRRLVRVLDKNKDGVINFEEFVEWAFTRGSGQQAGEKVLKT